MIRALGGEPGFHPVVYHDHKNARAKKENVDADKLTLDQLQECKKAACDEYIAALFIRVSNDKKYAPVKKELDNLYLFKRGSYPVTLDEAFRYLQNYKPVAEGRARNHRGDKLQEEGVSFYEQTERQIGPCDGCGKMGHLVRQCKTTSDDRKKALLAKRSGASAKQAQNHANVGETESKECVEGVSNISVMNQELQKCLDGVAHINIDEEEVSITSADGAEDIDVFDGVAMVLPSVLGKGKARDFNCGRNKLFLDSCATQHTMFASEYLTGQHTSKVYLKQNCNAGSRLTNKRGYWGDLPFYLLSEGGIANLLSMPALEQAGWEIELKTRGDTNALSPDGVLLTFKRDDGVTKGMPYIDMDRPKDNVSRVFTKDSMACVETVRKNMEGLTVEQFKRATAARDAMAMMAHPPEEKMKRLVSKTNVANVPFTPADFANGRAIFGPDRAALRGKKTRERPSRVRPELIRIPQQLFDKLKDVILTADLMFLNGLSFFITQSRGIKLITK